MGCKRWTTQVSCISWQIHSWTINVIFADDYWIDPMQVMLEPKEPAHEARPISGYGLFWCWFCKWKWPKRVASKHSNHPTSKSCYWFLAGNFWWQPGTLLTRDILAQFARDVYPVLAQAVKRVWIQLLVSCIVYTQILDIHNFAHLVHDSYIISPICLLSAAFPSYFGIVPTD